MLVRLLLALLAGLSTVSPCLATERSNVLLILVDDLKPALGCYGDSIAKTPNIDALAARGMRFDLAYCNQAVCAPSRFTLMLGSHSTSTGLYGLGSQLRQIVPDAVTLPQHFAKHGYRTESLGKVFHIGHGNHGDPDSFSVPHFHDKVIEYLDPASTDGGKLTREEAYFTNQKLGEIRSLPRGAAYESPDVDDGEYADGRVAAETMKRLQAAKTRREQDSTPFFITAGFARPHLPFSAPQKYWDLYDPASLPMPQFEFLPTDAPAVAGKRGGEITNYKPVPEDRNAEFSDDLKRSLIHGYYASMSFVDAQIGKVVGELDRLGLAENTIVVLWGDHGFHLGDLGIWTKHTNYEQANRIPILISAPGVTQPGSSTKQPAESVDIFPTLAELAGLPAPMGPQPIDGLSLVPVLKDGEQRVRDHAFHAYPKRKLGRAVRTERYRLVEWKNPGDADNTAEYELYDYEADPLETRNLAAAQPDVVNELKAKLAAYPDAIDPRRPARSDPETPQIANREITLKATVRGQNMQGVVMAQGGRQLGYALHFADGKPTLDVRINEKVTRLQTAEAVSGRVALEARITANQLSLTVNGQTVTRPSPGLIPKQPLDQLSIGKDDLSAAGDYESPNAFTGTILAHQVLTALAKMPAPQATFKDRPGRWPVDKANAWYDATAWPVGANFVPSTAINQLEMWQAETFDPDTIDRELGWAAEIGMNTMRVFLHDLAWQQDPEGFLKRVDRYLEIADSHGIRTMLVIFDGVWHPYPKPGPQPAPRPGLHNSGWVQSPGRAILEDPARHAELKPYVQALLRRFKDDRRVLVWDLFNEPDNAVHNSYGEGGTQEELPPPLKEQRATELLEKTFAWAREINPSQPLTCGVWMGNYLDNPSPIQRLSIEASDVVSFHTYGGPDEARRLTEGLLHLDRPVLCTEYMARGNRSTFEAILPIFHQHKVAAYNWGLVDGKSQTIYPWDSWDKPYTKEPQPWHHDVFRRDGSPYDVQETRLIQRLSKQPPMRQSDRP